MELASTREAPRRCRAWFSLASAIALPDSREAASAANVMHDVGASV
jgi:hypothetical protein